MSLTLIYHDALIYYDSDIHNPSNLLSALHVSVSRTERFASLKKVLDPLNRRSKLYRQWSWQFAEQQNHFPVPGFQPWLLCYLVRGLFSTLNTLSRLETTNKLFIFNCRCMTSTTETLCVLVIILNNISQCDRQKKVADEADFRR